ncbi:MAG: hypothetical protein LIO57_01670 [Oscillospiraceae bacterium]|nr:hypothetical protein [Oscillospiraceae bacterium]
MDELNSKITGIVEKYAELTDRKLTAALAADNYDIEAMSELREDIRTLNHALSTAYKANRLYCGIDAGDVME